jgi:hypothetical protein
MYCLLFHLSSFAALTVAAVDSLVMIKTAVAKSVREGKFRHFLDDDSFGGNLTI